MAVKISNIYYVFSPSLVTPGPQETQVWGRWGADIAQAKSEAPSRRAGSDAERAAGPAGPVEPRGEDGAGDGSWEAVHMTSV